MWPKLVVANSAGKPIPPNRAGEGSAGPTLGCLIEYLPIAIANTLHKIITAPTFGLHSRVVGTAASKDKETFNIDPELGNAGNTARLWLSSVETPESGGVCLQDLTFRSRFRAIASHRFSILAQGDRPGQTHSRSQPDRRAETSRGTIAPG